jgi:4-aminobutyrate---pyruvate transaminase
MGALIYPTSRLVGKDRVTIERGEGVYVYDGDGRRYLEGMAGLWCTALGYANNELIEVAERQLRDLSYSHMFGGKSHAVGVELAERLAETVPVENAKVFFGCSGSDANDTQIKLLRYYFNAIGQPQKRKIITRERAYHGVTVAAGALTSLPVNLEGFDPPVDALGILRTDHPHYYRGGLDGESENEFVERICSNLERQIIAEGPETIAAFLAEPITGASGVIVPPSAYYEKVQSILERYGILFWADEVITAFGRTGSDFGCTTMSIDRPDMMSLAKQLTSAYFPLSAAIVSGKLYESIVLKSESVGLFGHGYTYSGHPVGCAIALKALEIYNRPGFYDAVSDRGRYLQTRLDTLENHPLVGEVRGAGLLAGVELVADKASGAAFPDGSVGASFALRCEELGLIVRAVAGNTIALCPPLIITHDQIDEMVDILGRALDMTLASLSPAEKH